jgi:hypothetical protein
VHHGRVRCYPGCVRMPARDPRGGVVVREQRRQAVMKHAHVDGTGRSRGSSAYVSVPGARGRSTVSAWRLHPCAQPKSMKICGRSWCRRRGAPASRVAQNPALSLCMLHARWRNLQHDVGAGARGGRGRSCLYCDRGEILYF